VPVCFFNFCRHLQKTYKNLHKGSTKESIGTHLGIVNDTQNLQMDTI